MAMFSQNFQFSNDFLVHAYKTRVPHAASDLLFSS
jgi:hypothetical protein